MSRESVVICVPIVDPLGLDLPVHILVSGRRPMLPGAWVSPGYFLSEQESEIIPAADGIIFKFKVKITIITW